MPETFLQFSSDKALPFVPEVAGNYMLNPGNCLRSTMMLRTPLPSAGICTRFRTVIRGKWGPKTGANRIKLQITKNGRAQSEESTMTFGPNGMLGVVTRHKTNFPDIVFEKDDTIGILIISEHINWKVGTYYVSPLLNFNHD